MTRPNCPNAVCMCFVYALCKHMRVPVIISFSRTLLMQSVNSVNYIITQRNKILVKDNIRMVLMETVLEGADWIQLAWDMN